MNARQLICTFALLLLSVAPVRATSNYEYGADEYVTVTGGISPDGRLAITAHGEREYGYTNFHLYLFDAKTGKKIGPLEEISEVLDTGAEAFLAMWKKDSSEATIIYRVDRHAPLKAMTYRFAKGRAFPLTKEPVDLDDKDRLGNEWGKRVNADQPPGRTFGHPKQHP